MTYKVYAVRYARNAERRAGENFLGGDPHNGSMPMDFFVWAIVGEGRTIVVDTGFDENSGARRGRDVMRPVQTGLEQIGIRCDAVDDVIMTHMHWDHAGNHDLFPNSRYHVQDREMQYCTGRCMCQEVMRRPFDLDDVKSMVDKIYAERVDFHSGDTELAPGLSLHWVGGHSKGLQVVRVLTRRGWVVLASDAAHYYANFRQGRPFPIIHDLEDMFDGFRALTKLSSGPDHIIPGHDPEKLTIYPAASADFEGTVRLDLEPRVSAAT